MTLRDLHAATNDGSCKGLPISEFFMDTGQSPRPEIVEMCEACPVQQECNDLAVVTGATGFWAGKMRSTPSLIRERTKVAAKYGLQIDVMGELSPRSMHMTGGEE